VYACVWAFVSCTFVRVCVCGSRGGSIGGCVGHSNKHFPLQGLQTSTCTLS